MSFLTNIFFAVLILIISIISYIFYLNRNIESTAQLVSLGRYCSQLLNPNYTIEDKFNLGIDTIAVHFLQNIPDLNATCSKFNFVNNQFSNVIMQRAYYVDKQIVQTIQNDTERDFRQFVILGAGNI